jgi:hypothetical protein
MLAIWEDISQYWLLAVGAIIVFFFAKTHFNSPDYALSRHKLDSVTVILPKNSPAARLRTPAPPIFTTPRDRYRRAEWTYIVVIEAAFLFLSFFPDLLANIPGFEKLASVSGASLNTHIVAATLLVTGFLTSFPGVREADKWVVKFLHDSASIPDDSEQTAGELFKAHYKPDPDILATIVVQIRSSTMRAVSDGTIAGLLEERWLQIRCLAEKLKNVLGNRRYRQFMKKFEEEFDDIYAAVLRLREVVIKYEESQDKILAGKVVDIDEWLYASSSDPNVKKVKDERDKLTFDVEALHYRICLFCSLMAYSIELTDAEISTRLNNLGWLDIQIILPARKPWDILLTAGAATLVVCFIISAFYALIVQESWVVLGDYAQEIPYDLKQAGWWAVIACALHTSAASIASLLTIGHLRRLRADNKSLVWDNPLSKSFLFAVVASTVPLAIVALYIAFYRIAWVNLAWVALPFTTAYFTVGYIRESVGDRTATRLNTPPGQAIAMGILAFVLAIVIVPQDSKLINWPNIIWIFAIYATVIATAIGLTLGEVFKRSLAANVSRLFASDKGASRRGLLFSPAPDTTP